MSPSDIAQIMIVIAAAAVGYGVGFGDGRNDERRRDAKRRRIERIVATIEDAGRMTP